MTSAGSCYTCRPIHPVVWSARLGNSCENQALVAPDSDQVKSIAGYTATSAKSFPEPPYEERPAKTRLSDSINPQNFGAYMDA